MIHVEIVFGHYPKICSYPINNDSISTIDLTIKSF
jgi:hypothetical protein